MKARAGA